MEENCKLRKQYKLDFETFRSGYEYFQKKNVYPKSYLFMAIYLILVVIYVLAAVKDPQNTLVYILLFLCLALAFREWYNPRKLRRTMIDTFREIGCMNCEIKIDDKQIEISTLENETVENSEDSESETEEELPEAAEIPLDSDILLSECDSFFLLYIGKITFYIIPKDGWSEAELDVLRSSVPSKK
ncbi:MAG: hypothetical protein E7497_01830 [Ruminococcus sp.]|nr:hypothetical protein [Ruminococcus sp.]